MDSLLLDLTKRYTEPHRHYHTIEHVADMLAMGAPLGLSDEQLLAIWFHDAIYDPLRRDNEEQSAQLAVAMLRAEGWAPERIATVATIVRDTERHAPSIDASRLVIDLDLASLAIEWPAFEANRVKIRNEYRAVPEQDYRAGVRSFAESFLARPRIYWTDWGQENEARARDNLGRLLDQFS